MTSGEPNAASIGIQALQDRKHDPHLQDMVPLDTGENLKLCISPFALP
jgi:hypothetical protein